MTHKTEAVVYSWQRKGWPRFTFDRAALGDELRAFFIPVLTEMLTSFLSAARFVKAKRDYLARYEGGFSARARKVILRMFEDGEAGARGVLSAAKWMRMARVSKPTALADLAELEKTGAVVRDGGAQRLEYRLADFTDEPSNGPINGSDAGRRAEKPFENEGEGDIRSGARLYGEGINEGISDRLVKLVRTHPGSRLPYLKSALGKSAATVERAVATLVKAGRVEHRGSKKTGGYYLRGGAS